MGDSNINNRTNRRDIEIVKPEMARNSSSSKSSQLNTPCTPPATTKERNLAPKPAETASSPISKKDRILQSFAATTPTEENSEKDFREKDRTASRKRHLNDLNDQIKDDYAAEKRSRNPSVSTEDITGDCRWILVGKNGRVLIEAGATKLKIVSILSLRVALNF